VSRRTDSRTDAVTVLADSGNDLARLVFAVNPPFRYVADLTLKDIGLPIKEHYLTGEVAMAVGDERSVFVRRVLSGKYPDAALKVSLGHRRFTAAEVVEIAKRKERYARGLPLI